MILFHFHILLSVCSLLRLGQKTHQKVIADKDALIADVIADRDAIIAHAARELQASEAARIADQEARIAAERNAAALQRRLDELILRDAASGSHS